MTDVQDELRRVRARLERGWTKGALAGDAEGTPVSPTSPLAVSWCLLGAMVVEDISQRCIEALYCEVASVTDFSDAQESVEPVLALIDRAIEATR